MTKKIFVSIPMRGKEQYEIVKGIERLFKLASAYLGEECEMINSLEPVKPEELQRDDIVDVAPLYLGASIKLLSQADLVIFDKEWSIADGCCVEKQVCERYHIKHIVEPNLMGTFRDFEAYEY